MNHIKKKQRQAIPSWVWVLIVIFIIIVIIVYVASLGTVNISNESKVLSDFNNTKEEAIRKHAELQFELEKKQSLKRKLDQYFKIVYLFVRIALVCIIASSVYAFGKFSGANTIGDFLNYYEASIILLFALNFIAFGTIANFQEFIKLIKTNVENFVWRKNLHLMNQIESAKKSLEGLVKSISEFQTAAEQPAKQIEVVKDESLNSN